MDVPTGTNLTITFDEPIARGIGSINASGTTSGLRAVDAQDFAYLTISGSVAIIGGNSFAEGETVTVSYPAGVFEDLAANAAGASPAWSFTIFQSPPDP